MSKVAFVTLGCKLNYAETSTYERGLVEAGWTVVPWTDSTADLFLVNTCSVTEHSDKKSRNIIRKLHRVAPQADIVVTGCSAQLRRADIEKLEGVTRVFGASEKSQVVPFILGAAGGYPSEEPLPPLARPVRAASMQCLLDPSRPKLPTAVPLSAGGYQTSEGYPPAALTDDYFNAYSTGERTRSFLKVQDGCDYKCHYCTVPYARGESRNAPISTIVEDAKAIAATGVKEIVITGVNTGDFGASTGESFLELLKELNKVDGIERYRISSIEPNLLTEEIVDWIASGTKFLPHFHIPLQSGSDTILQNMGRRYLTAGFADKIAYIRKAMEKPGQQKVFFGIDVIAGFPGESDELFRETYDFLKNVVKPAFIHIFPYSKRPGTPAATMPGQVQDSVKTARVEMLEELCGQLQADFIESNRGLVSKVLFEQKTADGLAEGWSENYIRVTRPWKNDIINSIEEIVL